MDDYLEMNVNQAYKLIGHGPLVLISSGNQEAGYDIAPIAWNCPAAKKPSRIVLAVGSRHKTYENIENISEFIVCIPTIFQVELVRKTGSVSGKESDKFEEFCIEYTMGEKVKARLPLKCLGFMECKVVEKMKCGELGIFVGECVKAGVKEGVYVNGRICIEKKEAKTLHHLGSKVFAVPADQLESIE